MTFLDSKINLRHFLEHTFFSIWVSRPVGYHRQVHGHQKSQMQMTECFNNEMIYEVVFLGIAVIRLMFLISGFISVERANFSQFVRRVSSRLNLKVERKK
jgi:hypothetical protein